MDNIAQKVVSVGLSEVECQIEVVDVCLNESGDREIRFKADCCAPVITGVLWYCLNSKGQGCFETMEFGVSSFIKLI